MHIPFNLILLKVLNAQKKRIRPLMDAIGLSPGQPKVLTFLALHGPCLQKHLADRCDIEPATVSRLLNNLEEQQLISRTPQTGDRRAVLVALTPTGEALAVQEVAVRYEQVNSCSLSGFSEEEKRQFSEYLKRMYGNLTGTPFQF